MQGLERLLAYSIPVLLDARFDLVPEPEPVEREDAQVRNAPLALSLSPPSPEVATSPEKRSFAAWAYWRTSSSLSITAPSNRQH